MSLKFSLLYKYYNDNDTFTVLGDKNVVEAFKSHQNAFWDLPFLKILFVGKMFLLCELSTHVFPACVRIIGTEKYMFTLCDENYFVNPLQSYII